MIRDVFIATILLRAIITSNIHPAKLKIFMSQFIERHVYLFVGGMYFYAQHSGFDLFALTEDLHLFEESSAEACGRIVPEYRKQELPMPLRKTCSEWDEPAQTVPQSEAT